MEAQELDNLVAFEVNGNSMETEYNSGDKLICKEIPRSEWETAINYKDFDFVIKHSTQGTMLKEIISHNIETGEITCHSLNKQYSDFVINLRDVDSLYEVREHRIKK